MSKSTITLLVVLGIVGFVIVVVIGVYNNIVTLDEAANNAWGKVENVYQRRFDLIPNLVETAKGYLKHESSTFEEVAKARQQITQIKIDAEKVGGFANSAEMQKQFYEAQQGLGAALSRLIAVSEQYPDLKAKDIMVQLMDEQAGTENRVAVERGRFQDAVNLLNTKIRKFPYNIIAGVFGIEKREYYKAEEGAEKAPKVKF